MDSPAEELDSFIRNLDKATIRGMSRDGTSYPSFGFVIVNLIRRLERAHITLSCKVISPKELSVFNRKLFELSAMYENYSSFHPQLICFRNHRATLINKLISSACELDRNSYRISIVKVFGYTFAIISSLNLGIHLGGNFLENSLKISPILYLLVRYMFMSASCFGPVCLMASFAEYLHSKYILHCLIRMIKEDKMLFEQVNNWHLEEDVMRFLFTELFFQTTSQEIIKNVKENFRDLESTEKIFATILVSNMKNNPLCIQNKRFLYKTYLFSRTEAAAVWYNRLSYYIDPVDQEKDIRELEEGLLHLKMILCTSGLSAESLIFLLRPSILPRVVLSGLHSLCLLYEIKKFKHGNNYAFSNDLRKLALNSRNILRITRTV